MKTYNIPLNQHEKRFYPHYGTGSIKRKSNPYKNGKTKGHNIKETRLERQVKYSVILKNTKII